MNQNRYKFYLHAGLVCVSLMFVSTHEYAADAVPTVDVATLSDDNTFSDNTSNDSEDMSGGEIAGIVAGAVGGVAALGLGAAAAKSAYDKAQQKKTKATFEVSAPETGRMSRQDVSGAYQGNDPEVRAQQLKLLEDGEKSLKTAISDRERKRSETMEQLKANPDSPQLKARLAEIDKDLADYNKRLEDTRGQIADAQKALGSKPEQTAKPDGESKAPVSSDASGRSQLGVPTPFEAAAKSQAERTEVVADKQQKLPPKKTPPPLPPRDIKPVATTTPAADAEKAAPAVSEETKQPATPPRMTPPPLLSESQRMSPPPSLSTPTSAVPSAPRPLSGIGGASTTPIPELKAAPVLGEEPAMRATTPDPNLTPQKPAPFVPAPAGDVQMPNQGKKLDQFLAEQAAKPTYSRPAPVLGGSISGLDDEASVRGEQDKQPTSERKSPGFSLLERMGQQPPKVASTSAAQTADEAPTKTSPKPRGVPQPMRVPRRPVPKPPVKPAISSFGRPSPLSSIRSH